MNHFTDSGGFNAIRSQPTWTIKAARPRAAHNPVGAYFTTYAPTEPNLAKKIFVPRSKLAFVFTFVPRQTLLPMPGGRGHLGRIFFSPEDYHVGTVDQLHAGATGL
jgi:hypothetical protein